MDYLKQKEVLKEKAQKHTEKMQDIFSSEIKECVSKSIVYGGKDKMPTSTISNEQPNFKFINVDSISGIFETSNGKTAVLNFASYKNPGGRFIDGSFAQEESLCHNSFLYNVLKEFPEYYKWNSQNKNRALYLDRAIYSPNVIFEKDGKTKKCDVITCAAPNKGTAKRFQKVTDEENYEYLYNRAVFIKNIAEENNVETLILGAWGAGVFKQKVNEVANTFYDVFSNTSITNIVFAVIGNENTLKAFSK